MDCEDNELICNNAELNDEPSVDDEVEENKFGAPEQGIAEVTRKIGKEISPSAEKHKLSRLPLARVKHIIKMDPDCGIVNNEAVFLIAKATELFLEYFSKEAVKETISKKRKTMMKRDIEKTIDNTSNLCFLEGIYE